jgi:hypothetical protein
MPEEKRYVIIREKRPQITHRITAVREMPDGSRVCTVETSTDDGDS